MTDEGYCCVYFENIDIPILIMNGFSKVSHNIFSYA